MEENETGKKQSDSLKGVKKSKELRIFPRNTVCSE